MHSTSKALRGTWSALAAMILAAGAGCASVSEFERAQARWMERSIDEYMAETGASPTQVISNTRGSLYVFSYERRIETPSTTAATSPTIDGVPTAPVSPYPGAAQSAIQWCRWVFQTDSSRIITGFQHDGNACKM